MARTRTKGPIYGVNRGQTYNAYANGTIYIGPNPGPAYKESYGSCTDTVHPKPYQNYKDNLSLYYGHVDPARITIPFQGYRGVYWTDYPIASGTPDSISNQFFNPDEAINKVYGQINPNKPVVDLPLLLFELRELPRAIKTIVAIRAGRRRASDLPGEYLAYQFGWAPLLSDLTKLFRLASEISETEGKIAELLRKKKLFLHLGKEQSTWPGSTFTVRPNYWQTFGCGTHHELNREVWAVAELNSDDPLPGFGPPPTVNLSQALGTSPSFSTLWNAIPWGWLIDYFTTVGAYLDATRGGITHKLDVVSIMCHDIWSTRTDLDYALGISNYTFTPGTFTRDSKRRWIRYDPTPRITFVANPLVGKMGILGSLAANKFLKHLER